MKLTITDKEFNTLSPSARAEILALLSKPAQLARQSETSIDDWEQEFDWDDVVSLTVSQVSDFVAGCAPQTIEGLKIFAMHGPVLKADKLIGAGIENFAHFQGRVTKRVRTITGNRHAYLFTWDDWGSEENAGVGRYAITPMTYSSLKKHFGIN